MTITLRIVLIVISLMTLLWVIQNIRKSKVKIEDSVFWIFFAIFLVLISAFPKIISFGANLTGVQTDVNFLFLSVIFILIVKLFHLSVRISQLESKLRHFAQGYSLDKKDAQSNLSDKT